MQKTTRIIGLVFLVALCAGAGTGLLAFRNAHAQMGDQAIAKLIPIIEQVHQANGAYPTTLKFKTEKVWGIFPGPELQYRSDGADCDIYYAQWPLGTHHGFRCVKQEWYSER